MIRIRKAAAADLAAVTALLEASGLPTEGVAECFSRFLVAENDGRIVATAGLEIEGTSALLRSVAVEPASRGTGIGIEIARQALRLASVSGSMTVYLLTTAAAGFFPKLGFRPALRAEIEAEFPNSIETRLGGGCASAVPMVLRDLSCVTEPYTRR